MTAPKPSPSAGVTHLAYLTTISPDVERLVGAGAMTFTANTAGDLFNLRDLLDHPHIADATPDAITLEGSLRGLRVRVSVPHWQTPGVDKPTDAYSALMGEAVANDTSGAHA